MNDLTQEVLVHHNPIANFIASEVCLGRNTIFTNTTQINNEDRPYMLSYKWDLGNGSTSILVYDLILKKYICADSLEVLCQLGRRR